MPPAVETLLRVGAAFEALCERECIAKGGRLDDLILRYRERLGDDTAAAAAAAGGDSAPLCGVQLRVGVHKLAHAVAGLAAAAAASASQHPHPHHHHHGSSGRGRSLLSGGGAGSSGGSALLNPACDVLVWCPDAAPAVATVEAYAVAQYLRSSGVAADYASELLGDYDAARTHAMSRGARLLVQVKPSSTGPGGGSLTGGSSGSGGGGGGGAGGSGGGGGSVTSGSGGAAASEPKLDIHAVSGRDSNDALLSDAAAVIHRMLLAATGGAAFGLVTAAAAAPALLLPTDRGGAAAAALPAASAAADSASHGTHSSHGAHGHGGHFSSSAVSSIRVHMVESEKDASWQAKRVKLSAAEKRITARLAASSVLNMAGGAAATAATAAIHVVAADLPWRVLREVGTAAACTGSAEEAWAQLAAAPPDAGVQRSKRLVKDTLDMLFSLQATRPLVLYSVPDDKIDMLY